MSGQTLQSYQQISRKLTKIGFLWNLLILSQVVFKWIALSIALLLIFIAIKSITQNLFTLGILGTLGTFLSLLWYLISIALGVYLAIKSGFNLISKDKTAAWVDSKFPGLEDRIVSAVQLFPELQQDRYGYSRTFLSKIIDEANSRLNSFSFKSILADDLKDLKKTAALFALCLIILLTSYSLFPNSFQNFFQSFAFYADHNGQHLGFEIIQVQPGDYEIEPGEDVKVVAKVKGVPPSKVKLFYKNVGNVGDSSNNVGDSSNEEWTSEEMSPADKAGQFNRHDQTANYQITLKNVSESLKYYVLADHIRSKEYQISTIRHPLLSKFQLKLNYPKYSQLPPKTLEENLGEINALNGTYVEFSGKANKPLESAQLIFDDGSNVGNVGNSFKVDMRVTNQIDINGGFTVKKSGRYYISLTDPESHQNREPIAYPINAIKDQPPKVEIISPAQDVVLDESMKIPLEIEATDDYGVRALKLNYKIEGQKPEEKSLTLKVAKTPDTTMSTQYSWELNPLKLYPEDVVVYYAEASDTDEVSGPNVGRSRSYMARFPSLIELMEEVENEQGKAYGSMEKTLEDQRDVKAITDELADRLRKNQELTWNEKKQFEKAIQTQQEIQKQAQRLTEQLEQTTSKIEERSLLSRETIEKHQQLQKLIEEVATEEMKEAMKKLAEALKELTPSEQEKKMLAASFKEEELIQRLEQMLELFKKLRLQQKLEAAVNEAKELKEHQAEISEQTKQASDQFEQTRNPKPETRNPNVDELSKREERNAETLSKLQQELQSLSEEMKKEGANYNRVAEEVSQLEQESRKRQIESNLRLASRKLRQNQPQSALEPANEALAGLKDLHQGLDNAMEFMRGANAEKALKAMQKAVRGGLHMSENHEQIMDQTSQLLSNLKAQPTPGEKRRMDTLAAEELRMAEEAEMVAQQLLELGSNENAMMVDPRLVWRLRAASDALSRAARALEDKSPNLAIPMQKGALSDINRTVAELLKAMDQMNQQLGASGLENMLEQLEQLAQNQSQLNELSKQLSDQMRQQGRSRQVEDMLKQMAYEQSVIREATQRLAEKLDRLAQTLGNLSDVAKDMQDVEGELRKGKVDQNVLKKQREILTRLLESEKSLQKRQTSQKRKAQTAKQQNLGSPPSQLDPELTKLKKELSRFDITESEKLPEEYKELIQLYYKALSEKVRR